MFKAIPVKIKGYNGTFDYKAVVLTEEEWQNVCSKEFGPDLVSVDGRIFYEEYTCHGGYSGTCNCINHPRKSWREYLPEEERFGDIVFEIH